MDQVTIQQINSSIMFGNLSNENLDTILQAIKYRRAQIGQQNKRALRVGDTVKFTSNRNGVTYSGTVDKVKIKYILVRTGAGMFNVPANMLEAV